MSRLTFSQEDIDALADLVADCFTAPRVEPVLVPQSPRRASREVTRRIRRSRTVEDVATPERSVSRRATFAVALGAGLVALVLDQLLISVALFLVTLVAFIRTSPPSKPASRIVEEEVPVTEIEEYEEPVEPMIEMRTIPNSRTVTFVGRFMLPILAMPVRSRTLVASPALLAPSMTLNAQWIREADRARELGRALVEATDNVPWILQGPRQPFRSNTPSALGDTVELVGSEAQLAQLHEQLAQLLSNHRPESYTISSGPAAGVVLSAARPRKEPAREHACFEEARRLLTFLHERESSTLEHTLRGVLRQATIRDLTLDGVRYAAMPAGIGPLCADLGHIFHYSEFNFYCPSCNAALLGEIQARDYSVQAEATTPPYHDSNTRCFWDHAATSWRCRTCQTTTFTPIPIHKMLDEILYPAFDRLMEENKNERLRVYGQARTSELHYRNELEREQDALFMRNRAALEHVDIEIRRLDAVVAGEDQAVTALRKLSAEYGVAQSQALKTIMAEQGAVIAAILARQTATSAHLDEVFDTQREEMVELMSRCSRAKRIEDEQRDQAIRSIARNMAETAMATRSTAESATRMTGQLQHIREAAEVTAANTSRMTEQLDDIGVDVRRTADAGERTATASERTAQNTTGLREAVETGNQTRREMLDVQRRGLAYQAAMDVRQGGGPRAPWWNLAAQSRAVSASLISSIAGDDQPTAAARLERAVRP